MARVLGHYFSAKKAALFAGEATGVALASWVGGIAGAWAFATSGAQLRFPIGSWVFPIGALVAAILAAAYLCDLYDLKVAVADGEGGRRLMGAMGGAVGFVGVVSAFAPIQTPSGLWIGAASGGILGALAARAVGTALIGRTRTVVVVGPLDQQQEVARTLEAEGEGVYRVCTAPSSGVALHELAPRLGADTIVATSAGHVAGDALLQCRVTGLKVYDVSRFFEQVLRRLPVDYLRPEQLALSDRLAWSWTWRLAKRALDLVLAGGLLLVAAPVMLLIAVLVKADSPGPALYSQERVGLGGRAFRLRKFRSMRLDAERGGAVWAKENDDRVTRIGRFIRKTRLDELPQLWNVLCGDMSLVGPRPERPVFVEKLREQIPFYDLRALVKPGLTGWAQIRYPYGASVEDARRKLEFDLYYVKNGTIALDLAIVFHTVRHVLQRRGAR